MRKAVICTGLALVLCGAVTAVRAATPQRAAREHANVRRLGFWSKACEIATTAYASEIPAEVLGKALGTGEGLGTLATLLLGDDPLGCAHFDPGLSRQDLQVVENTVAQELRNDPSFQRLRTYLQARGGQLFRSTPRLSPFSRPQLGMEGSTAPYIPGPFHVISAGVNWFQIGYRGLVDVEVKPLGGVSNCYLFRRVLPRPIGGQGFDLGTNTVALPTGTTWQVGIRAASNAEGCTPLDGALFRWASHR
jgi:hypothetical protein